VESGKWEIIPIFKFNMDCQINQKINQINQTKILQYVHVGENIHMICIHFYPNPYEIANCFLRERFQRGCHSYFKENVGKISHHIDLPGL
jgi:hypothetical protein